MKSQAICVLFAAGFAAAQETVLGVYIFSRHGDRTAKAWPPTNLTTLGYQEVYNSGTNYRDRYIASGATQKVQGLSSDVVKLSQLAVSAPVDTVLQNSAQAFVQGLYPAVGEQTASSKLRNGTVVDAPLDGYQLIPINAVSNGASNENSAWLQGNTNCANAQISSNDYFNSKEYMDLYNSSTGLYQRIYPDVNNTFTSAQNNYKNAYVIWDLLNVASIHNATAPLPDDSDFFALKLLANQHEFALAYNATEPIRAVTGSIIAGQVLSALNSSITTPNSAQKLNVQFGAYGGMMSYFGLSQLIDVDPNFYGIPDYASTLVWELVTNSTGQPTADEVSVRFLFNNGTSAQSAEPIEYPLFGSNQSPMPWNEFATNMQKIAISNQQDWCTACGNSTGVCSAAALDDGSSSSSTQTTTSNSGGLSKAVCGVIGAMVTLGVILGLELLFLGLGGFRLVSKKRLAGQSNPAADNVQYPKAHA